MKIFIHQSKSGSKEEKKKNLTNLTKSNMRIMSTILNKHHINFT